MGRLRFNRRSDRAKWMATIAMELEIERRANSEANGREVVEIRDVAASLRAVGRHDEALEAYQRAWQLVEGQVEHSCIRGMAAHDLAEALCGDAGGPVRTARLLRAQRLLDEALASDSRLRDPRRRALTLDARARCAKNLAMSAGHVMDPRPLWKSASLDFAEAIGILEGLGPYGWPDIVQVWQNLGNFALLRGARSEAAGCLRRAVEYAAAIDECPEEFSTHPKRQEGASRFARLALARVLLDGGDREDVREVDVLLSHSARGADPAMLSRVALLRARSELLRGSADGARDWLSGIVPHHLDESHLVEAVLLHERVGEVDNALHVIHHRLDRLHEERSHTWAHEASDHVAARAQRVTRVLAEIHTRQRRPIDAFLALESWSGTRSFDHLRTLAEVEGSVAARELERRVRISGQLAIELDSLVTHALALGDDELVEALEDTEAVARRQRSDLGGRIAAACERVRRAEAPRRALAQEAESAQHEHRVDMLAAERHGPRTADREADGVPTAAVLAQILREHSHDALVHVHLDHHLHVVSVWMEEGELRGASALVDLPDLGSASPRHSLDRLVVQLESVDVSAGLPPVGRRIAWVVPSRLAARMPAAAWGGRERLADRCEGICVLPNLVLLQQRPRPTRPRGGAVFVAPGAALSNPTESHGLALEAFEGVLLEGERATWSSIAAAARTASVVSFYTHGVSGEDHEGLALAGGEVVYEFGSALMGAERVELWACSSGRDDNVELMQPPDVDDLFGLDARAVLAGCQGAIGTLWPVRDLVTGFIVRRYRQALAAGRPAPCALLDAQKWWRDEGARRVVEAHGRRDTNECVELGGVLGGLDALLGPMSAADSSDEVLRRLVSPTVWAAYRFVGTFDRGPRREWVPVDARPPTPEECAQVEAWLAEARSAIRGPGESVEALSAEEDPNTPEGCVLLGHRALVQVMGDDAVPLLAALAWWSEALADPAFTGPERARTERHVAWTWLDLARSGWSILHLTDVQPVLLHRALAALPIVGSDPTDVAFRWVCEALTQPVRRRSAVGATEIVDQLLGVAASVEVLRALSHVVTFCDPADLSSGLRRDRLFAAMMAHPGHVATTRLGCALVSAGGRDFARFAGPVDRPGHALPVLLGIGAAAMGSDAAMRPVAEQRLSEVLTDVEAFWWGRWRDAGEDFFLSVGTPDGGWWRAAGWLYQSFLQRGTPRVHQLIGCLQLAADLRVVVEARMSRLDTSDDSVLRDVASAVRSRQRVWDLLLDAACAPDLRAGSHGLPIPSAADPFALAGAVTRSAVRDPAGAPSWMLVRHVDEIEARTLAAAIVRRDGELARALQGTVAAMGDVVSGEDLGRRGWLPRRHIDELEHALTQLPVDRNVVSLYLSPVGELVVLGVVGGVVRHRVVGDGLGVAIVQMLRVLTYASRFDLEDGAAMRAERWAELVAALDDHIDAVLGDASGVLDVFSPGALRALPWVRWAGPRGGRPVRFRAVRHVASLDAALDSAPGAPRRPGADRAGLVVGDVPPDGPAGAVTRSLASALGDRSVLGVGSASPSTGIVGADLSRWNRSPVGTLRMVAAPDLLAWTEGCARMMLDRSRMVNVEDLAHLDLRHAPDVEIWSAVAVSAPVLGRGDRLPAFVRELLGGGARSVLDLAWPVSDAAIAIVLEGFALARRAGAAPACAIVTAIAEARGMLPRPETSDADRAALIDAARKARWTRAGLGAGEFVALAPLIGLAGDWADVDLDAFRVWEV